MPSSAEHRDKADRNRSFLNGLDATAAPEWCAVVAFYTALHLVERLSACESVHHAKHQDRLNYLSNKKNGHRRIHTNFLALYDAAHVARYGTVNQFETAFPGDTVQKQLIDKHLNAIEEHIVAHFAPVSKETTTGTGS